MSKYLIRKEEHGYSKAGDKGLLNISELFYDTMQGEGAGMGYPAVFLRLQGCTLDCVWCDTEWRLGGTYSFEYVCKIMHHSGVVEKLKNGHRLILTGGSPLKQQEELFWFIHYFHNEFKFFPVVEVENECTIMPTVQFSDFVDVWNNSPKLASSGMKRAARIKPKVLKHFSELCRAWFKFVVSCEEDWEEIKMDFIDPGYIRKDQIILMPLAGDYAELTINRQVVSQMAIKYGVRYSTREQLILGLA